MSFHVKPGDGATFTKTVSEYDVYGFAGITGDFSPNHVNKAYIEKSSYGGLQAHRALMVGSMSTASTLAIANTRDGAGETPVSLGYDRIASWPRSISATPSPSTTASPPSTPSAAVPPATSASPTRMACCSPSTASMSPC